MMEIIWANKIKQIVIIIGLSTLIASSAIAMSSKDIETEKKLGHRIAAREDKKLKFITDEKDLERIQRIGNELAAIAKTTVVTASYGNSDLVDYNYTFKLVDDKEVNAFSIPGGYIYINKGLLDIVDSDDELAGVIAHEIAHSAHHHVLQFNKKAYKYIESMIVLGAAALLWGNRVMNSDEREIFWDSFIATVVFQVSKMGEYSWEAEYDADFTAIEYLLKTDYNPVGLLVFIERFARAEAYSPVYNDIFRDHPFCKQRAENIIAQIRSHDLPINRRSVGSSTVNVWDITVENKPLTAEVVLAGNVILKPADLPDKTKVERARAIADTLNKALNDNPNICDVRLGIDSTSVYIRKSIVVDVRPEDAELSGNTREALALSVKQAIQAEIVRGYLKLLY